MPFADPYDELPYRSFPIEWTAPERLGLASLFHGGPRWQQLPNYRALELGCGAGGNLLPLAYFRRHAAFVGLDGARSQIEIAQCRRTALGLTNIELVHANFLKADQELSGQFDFIIAHGVFSWVPSDDRDALLQIFASRLRHGGLLYLNYNTRPGWNIRGLVREFLLAQTAGEANLQTRSLLAKEVAGRVVSALTGVEHHYSQLLANEFRFAGEGDVTWVGHEFLAADNHAYWRSEFLALARCHGLEYVADADFNYASGRIPQELALRLDVDKITGRSIEDTVDLLCYRQLHSPIMTLAPFIRKPPGVAEFGNLTVASCLEPCAPGDGDGYPMFKHPSGYEVEAKQEFMRIALDRLYPLWPRGLRVAEAFADVAGAEEDLRLLHRNGLIELRCIEPSDFGVEPGLLNKLEREWGGYFTTPYHQCGRRTD